MGLLGDRFIASIGDKVLGKKENGELFFVCRGCGKSMSLEGSTCSNATRKVIERNMKTRAVASLALAKLPVYCSKECEAKSQDVRVDLSEEEKAKLVQEVVDEAAEEPKA
jgi:hypothetical protein